MSDTGTSAGSNDVMPDAWTTRRQLPTGASAFQLIALAPRYRRYVEIASDVLHKRSHSFIPLVISLLTIYLSFFIA